LKIKRFSITSGRTKKLEISIRPSTNDGETMEYNSKLVSVVSCYNKKKVLGCSIAEFTMVAKELEQVVKTGEKFGVIVKKSKKNRGKKRCGDIGIVSVTSEELIKQRPQIKVLGKRATAQDTFPGRGVKPVPYPVNDGDDDPGPSYRPFIPK